MTWIQYFHIEWHLIPKVLFCLFSSLPFSLFGDSGWLLWRTCTSVLLSVVKTRAHIMSLKENPFFSHAWSKQENYLFSRIALWLFLIVLRGSQKATSEHSSCIDCMWLTDCSSWPEQFSEIEENYHMTCISKWQTWAFCLWKVV